MTLLVEARGRHIATFRFVAVRCMEIVAAWTPTTPEMEVKVLFGRHIWDFARHADALGKRTFELRLPEQHSLRPSPAYVALLEHVAALRGTAERIGSLYEVVLPGLERRYARYLEMTDPLLDGPSVTAVEQILADLARQRRDATRLRETLGLPAWDARPLGAREAAIEELVPLTEARA